MGLRRHGTAALQTDVTLVKGGMKNEVSIKIEQGVTQSGNQPNICCRLLPQCPRRVSEVEAWELTG